MNIQLVKTNVKNLEIFSNGKLEIDFFAEKRVYTHEKEESVVSNLFNNIYKLNNVALVGKNATGKTTTLNIISDILKIYIENYSISEVKNLGNYFNSDLIIENILTDSEYIYKINSIIRKDDMETLYFDQETLYTKKISSKLTKKELFNFSEDDIEIKRSDMNNKFLKKEDSIFSGILNNYEIPKKTYVRDMGRFTNFNFLGFFTEDMPLSFVNYLDPSIESFRVITSKNDIVNNNEPRFAIKFKEAKKEIKIDHMNLETYLSSGTIKGINVLINTMLVLKSGGYLLIDEIENHLNKSIVINLINLFTSSLNQKGATLIFTTHYSEVLDSIERSDSIYILNKKEKISINKFSKLAENKDRQDKKKSDLMLSGELGTSPSYFAYKKLKKDLKKRIERREN